MTKKIESININIEGVITATSNKQGRLRYDEPRKSVYVKVDEKTAANLEKLGLTKFTTKDDKVDFFILKPGSLEIKLYNSKKELSYISCGVNPEDKNFSTNEKIVGLSLLYGTSENGSYVRLTAINDTQDTIEFVEDINPFESDDEAVLEVNFDDLPF